MAALGKMPMEVMPTMPPSKTRLSIENILLELD
jgi:hypothetical protein